MMQEVPPRAGVAVKLTRSQKRRLRANTQKLWAAQGKVAEKAEAREPAAPGSPRAKSPVRPAGDGLVTPQSPVRDPRSPTPKGGRRGDRPAANFVDEPQVKKYRQEEKVNGSGDSEDPERSPPDAKAKGKKGEKGKGKGKKKGKGKGGKKKGK